jgi:predicted aconitase
MVKIVEPPQQSFQESAPKKSLGTEVIAENLKFILFLGLLAAIYIGNSHSSEKKIRNIQELQKELKEVRWTYLSLKSEVMMESQYSEVVKKVAPLGLSPEGDQPKVFEMIVEK